MIGDRIRQARLAKALTLDGTAQALKDSGESISKQALSNYEKNKRTPRPTTLMRLAGIFGVHQRYFLEESTLHLEWTAYRCQARLGARKKEEIEAFAQSIAEKYLYLREALFPSEKPNFPSRRKVTCFPDAEKSAQNLRNRWGLGDAPIDSLTRTIESNGGIVVGCDFPNIRFDGLSGWANGSVPVLVVNSLLPDDRRRFDLAHELGHLVMDCRGCTKKEEERMAHRFAGALLVPENQARRELGLRRRTVTFGELATLKRKYGLSMQGWLSRARDLEIITQSLYKNMFIEFSKRGWRKQEPEDFKGDEKPLRLLQMTLRALAENIITQEKAMDLCPEITMEKEERTSRESPGVPSARDLMRLPPKKRKRILAKAAALVETDYLEDKELTAFEALDSDDFQE